MADHRPYRGHDGFGQPEQRASGGNDPLAELARLIGGQNDPFAAPQHQRRNDNPADWRPSAEFDQFDPRVAAANTDYPEPFPPSAEPRVQSYAAPAYADPRGPGPSAGYDNAPRSFGPPPFPPAGQGGYGSDPYYAEHDDEYDDHVPARRRGGMLTVMAVVALGLIGTAGVFGYRAIFGNSGSSTPPVIKADTTPAKIVPATQPGDTKQIYDRVGDRSQPERVVSREEKPVDVADTIKTPRVVGNAPAPAANLMSPPAAPAIPASASALAPTGGASPVVSAAPKRVRTVTIKQDGSDEAPVARSAPAQVQQAAPPAAERVMASAEPVAPAAAPRAVQTRSVPVQRQAAADPNAPLSLSPPVAGAAPRAPVIRTASAPAAAPVAASSGGGGYSVQISSQRSEAEAQAAFRSLQAKFPGQLGGQQPVIRRADLGDKGVYYRVQVGPYASSDQASEMCSSLKNAGGSCVVQRN